MQRQRGGANDNPTVAEFCKNTQALRVVASLKDDAVRGNCQGPKRTITTTVDSTGPIQNANRNDTNGILFDVMV